MNPDDEGDMHDEEEKEPTNPTDPATEGSSKPPKKRKGTKARRSKAWSTFDELPVGEDKVIHVRCSKCGYTCIYNSTNGTGNMLKHQKVCLNTGDIRQMILSSSQGSISLRNTSFDPKIFRDLITSAVVRHNLPLSFVEYEGVREAFLYANPSATLVSRNTLKSDIIALYKHERKLLFNLFKTYELLNFSYMPSPYTGITISDKIYKLLCEWNLEFKLFGITLDNATSNDAFVNLLRNQLNLRNALLKNGQFFHIRCCAHILNLIVQEGLKDMDACVVKVRESVKYIKGSQGRKEKFRECIAQVALKKIKGFRQDVPTRWNSTYLMLDGALYYRRAFTHLELSDSNYKHALNDEEWDKVEGICKFLGVFYNVTRLFSGSKYPTANLYFPNVFLVQLTLMKAIEDRNYVARSLATQMKPKFDKYWAEYNTILAIAVVFDPRYKTHFVELSYKMLYGEDCEQIPLLHETLKQLF